MANVIPTWSLVQETKEFIPLTVDADGTPVTSFSVAVEAGETRPTGFLACDTVGSEVGVLVGVGTSWPLVVGTKYTVYVKFTDSPEIPVTRALYIKTT
jgi:hypothetical protein